MNKDLIKEAETLIAEVDKTHRYSMSKIYGLYNRIFGTNETPQSCASCLIRKVRELREWLGNEKAKTPEWKENVFLSDEQKEMILNAPKKRGRKSKEA